jgi:hypothetical protein
MRGLEFDEFPGETYADFCRRVNRDVEVERLESNHWRAETRRTDTLRRTHGCLNQRSCGGIAPPNS